MTAHGAGIMISCYNEMRCWFLVSNEYYCVLQITHYDLLITHYNELIVEVKKHGTQVGLTQAGLTQSGAITNNRIHTNPREAQDKRINSWSQPGQAL